ncbi:hypothetical protein ACFRCX_16215 [Streptomyces sp. NPDC056652]|uniref:hypothetical protein n=1 Tax=Streptomyces sp. NPDC056652 TaxID=3345893 RepID=UPI0036BF4AA0
MGMFAGQVMWPVVWLVVWLVVWPVWDARDSVGSSNAAGRLRCDGCGVTAAV